VPVTDALGKTTISWKSVDGKIYVSANGGEEVLFANSPLGSQDVNWIAPGSSYEFRLYNADRKTLLKKIIVTTAH
jgi:hypothetical protein